MRKLNLYLTFTFVCAFTLISCTNELKVCSAGKSKFNLCLEATLNDIEEEYRTKATADAVVRLSWNVGDKISVINLTTGKALGGDLVATCSGKTALFSGTLIGTINKGNRLLFLYPSQGYKTEIDFNSAIIDLSKQTGSSDVPFCVYATSTIMDTDMNSLSLSFSFMVSYIQINLTDLPKSSSIDTIVIEDMGPRIIVRSNQTKDDISYSSDGNTITIIPSSSATNIYGSRTLFLSTGPAPETIQERSVSVDIANKKFISKWTKSTIRSGRYYNSIISSFMPSYTSNDNLEDFVFQSYLF